MLPYQAVAMDYAVASAGFHHHHQRQGVVPGVMGLGSPAFTHSWFVQPTADLCRPTTTNQSHLEPGHVMFIYLLLLLNLLFFIVLFLFGLLYSCVFSFTV